jgi:CRP/FNR family transcriptional regulator, anaerobic regulatory protein
MVKATVATDSHGAAIRAVEPWAPSAGQMDQLLSADERARLAVVASIVRFKKGEVIYHEGDRAEAIFNIINGVVTAYRKAPHGSEHVAAFLFPDDLFGLSDEGRYANSTRATTPMTAYRIPMSALRSQSSRDAELEFHVICKLSQEFRQAQRRAPAQPTKGHFKVGDISAISRTTPSCQRRANGRNLSADEPVRHRGVRRIDACRLEQGVSQPGHSGDIKVRDLRHVSIMDRNSFENIALAS